MKTTGITMIVVLIISTIIFFISRYAVYLNLCIPEDYSCRLRFDTIENLFLFGPILLVVLIPIFLLPTHYFTAFFQFARFGLPLTIAALFYINLTYDSGLFGFGAGLDLLLIGLCYSLFILGSLSALGWAWWRGR